MTTCTMALGSVDSLHVLKAGIFEILGFAQNATETIWFRIPTCLAKQQTFFRSTKFADFWDAIGSSERTYILRLGTTCIVNREGQVLESYTNDELKFRSKTYQREERLVDDNIIRVLLQKVQSLEEKMEKVYNAPNMPGAVEAERRFRTQLGT